ncbi:MAG: DUF4349 domain-containing protein [Candidatus Omnitrophica bacterium]|nr:DUF4349 domain-containing protein [Candidatus Omnitrophota bacterium]MDE2222945.1 DUF4349 domain-containing protein [Candidatus Omnitrophota bacterium]
MTHEEIKILISSYIDGEVTPSQKDIVEAHLASCAECQKDLKAYKAVVSSLSKWPDERLSPDEEINMQKRMTQRREPMSRNTMMALGTTLALTIIVGSVFQVYVHRGMQGRLRSAADLGDQYNEGGLKSTQNGPFYMASNYVVKKGGFASGQAFEAKAMLRDAYSAPMSAGMMSMPAAVRIRVGQESAYYQNSNAYYAASDEERKKIERADISLLVDNAFKIKSQITDLILQFNGIVASSDFNRLADGSGWGTMVCKVYPKDLEHVLQQIRKLGEVEQENETSRDVTDQYNEAQSKVSTYTIEKEHLEKQLKAFKLFNPTTDAEKENIQRQIEQTKARIKALERMLNFYEKQSSMSTIVVRFHDNYKTALKDHEASHQWKVLLRHKWEITRDASLEVFTGIFFGVIYLLSYVVPVLVWAAVFGVIYLIVRLFFRK